MSFKSPGIDEPSESAAYLDCSERPAWNASWSGLPRAGFGLPQGIDASVDGEVEASSPEGLSEATSPVRPSLIRGTRQRRGSSFAGRFGQSQGASAPGKPGGLFARGFEAFSGQQATATGAQEEPELHQGAQARGAASDGPALELADQKAAATATADQAAGEPAFSTPQECAGNEQEEGAQDFVGLAATQVAANPAHLRPQQPAARPPPCPPRAVPSEPSFGAQAHASLERSRERAAFAAAQQQQQRQSFGQAQPQQQQQQQQGGPPSRGPVPRRPFPISGRAAAPSSPPITEELRRSWQEQEDAAGAGHPNLDPPPAAGRSNPDAQTTMHSGRMPAGQPGAQAFGAHDPRFASSSGYDFHGDAAGFCLSDASPYGAAPGAGFGGPSLDASGGGAAAAATAAARVAAAQAPSQAQAQAQAQLTGGGSFAAGDKAQAEAFASNIHKVKDGAGAPVWGAGGSRGSPPPGAGAPPGWSTAPGAGGRGLAVRMGRRTAWRRFAAFEASQQACLDALGSGGEPTVAWMFLKDRSAAIKGALDIGGLLLPTAEEMPPGGGGILWDDSERVVVDDDPLRGPGDEDDPEQTEAGGGADRADGGAPPDVGESPDVRRHPDAGYRTGYGDVYEEAHAGAGTTAPPPARPRSEAPVGTTPDRAYRPAREDSGGRVGGGGGRAGRRAATAGARAGGSDYGESPARASDRRGPAPARPGHARTGSGRGIPSAGSAPGTVYDDLLGAPRAVVETTVDRVTNCAILASAEDKPIGHDALGELDPDDLLAGGGRGGGALGGGLAAVAAQALGGADAASSGRPRPRINFRICLYSSASSLGPRGGAWTAVTANGATALHQALDVPAAPEESDGPAFVCVELWRGKERVGAGSVQEAELRSVVSRAPAESGMEAFADGVAATLGGRGKGAGGFLNRIWGKKISKAEPVGNSMVWVKLMDGYGDMVCNVSLKAALVTRGEPSAAGDALGDGPAADARYRPGAAGRGPLGAKADRGAAGAAAPGGVAAGGRLGGMAERAGAGAGGPLGAKAARAREQSLRAEGSDGRYDRIPAVRDPALRDAKDDRRTLAGGRPEARDRHLRPEASDGPSYGAYGSRHRGDYDAPPPPPPGAYATPTPPTPVVPPVAPSAYGVAPAPTGGEAAVGYQTLAAPQVYDELLAAALRASGCGPASLRVDLSWLWLLQAVASTHGVRAHRCSLSRLRWLLRSDVRTATPLWLGEVREAFDPLLAARSRGELAPGEEGMLTRVEERAIAYVGYVLERYHSLDESSPTGLSGAALAGARPQGTPSALQPATALIRLLKPQIDRPGTDDAAWLKARLSAAAIKRYSALVGAAELSGGRGGPGGAVGRAPGGAAAYPRVPGAAPGAVYNDAFVGIPGPTTAGTVPAPYDAAAAAAEAAARAIASAPPDPPAAALAYARAGELCLAIVRDLRADALIDEAGVLPSSVHLAETTAGELARAASRYVRTTLANHPPPEPSAGAVELVDAVGALQAHIRSRHYRKAAAVLNARDLFDGFVRAWIELGGRRLLARAEEASRGPGAGGIQEPPTWMEADRSPGARASPALLDAARACEIETARFSRVLAHWPSYGPAVERAAVTALRAAVAGASRVAGLVQRRGDASGGGRSAAPGRLAWRWESPDLERERDRVARERSAGAKDPPANGANVTFALRAGLSPSQAVFLNSLRHLLAFVPQMERRLEAWAKARVGSVEPDEGDQATGADRRGDAGAARARDDYGAGYGAGVRDARGGRGRDDPRRGRADADDGPIGRRSDSLYDPPADGPSLGAESMAFVKDLRSEYFAAITLCAEALAAALCDESRSSIRLLLRSYGTSAHAHSLRQGLEGAAAQLTGSLRPLARHLDSRVYVAISRGVWDLAARDVIEYAEDLSDGRRDEWRGRRAAGEAARALDEAFSRLLTSTLKTALQDKDLARPAHSERTRKLLADTDVELDQSYDVY